MIGFQDIHIDVKNRGLDVLYNGFLILYGTQPAQIVINNEMTISIKNEENENNESSLSFNGTDEHLDVTFYNLSKSSVSFSHDPAIVGTINNRELLISIFLNSRFKDKDTYIYLVHYCLYLGLPRNNDKND